MRKALEREQRGKAFAVPQPPLPQNPPFKEKGRPWRGPTSCPVWANASSNSAALCRANSKLTVVQGRMSSAKGAYPRQSFAALPTFCQAVRQAMSPDSCMDVDLVDDSRRPVSFLDPLYQASNVTAENRILEVFVSLEKACILDQCIPVLHMSSGQNLRF
jgi:hypothetical protein